MDGLLIIDKPPGVTSHDVIARARHILHQRRIGHTGTLDPFATGVLVILLGRATRLAQFVAAADKEYEAIIRLGYATDTGDRTGTPIEDQRKPGGWSGKEIDEALKTLRGDIQQIPPMFSAKKIKGQKLYEMARRGETVERVPINVCIHEFEAIKQDGQLYKDNLDGTFDLLARVVCSSGTYVRRLAEDFGERLSVGAHLAELRRTRVGPFSIEKAVTLDELRTSFGEERLGTILLPPDEALPQLPFVHLSDDDVRKASHGMEVRVAEARWPDGEKVKIYGRDGQFIGVGDYNAATNEIHPRVVITHGND
ncbi:MAG TPA: tRNA pseudouridine(55) synthase TruB [Pyrinomonadaceae bacterium]|jgi:tRNA pseudouridine55 synthase|nr:tRNA pseudouridine(55) synthase TruB [Pyrinomonadaceae bacterium]